MKNRWLKILLFAVGTFVVVILGGIGYIKLALPDVGPPPDITIHKSLANMERGKYLANHVMVCMECHSQRNWELQAAPPQAGTKGAGGEVHNQRLGFPGIYVSTNLTPYHLKDWTDGEIFRAITSGVNKEGKALFPIMPHPNFGTMDERDIYSVISYLRSLSPIEYVPETSASDFPMNFIINLIPQKANLQPAPPQTDTIAYGKYLVKAGVCKQCHTRQDNQGGLIGPEFGGGFEFKLADGSIVRSANLTSHSTGIGNWSESDFINRFKLYQDSAYVYPPVAEGEFQTVMPWTTYSGMTEQDLKAIYAYLRSLDPVDHSVLKFTSVHDLKK